MSRSTENPLLTDRVLDILKSRAHWGPGRACLSFTEIAQLLFARFPGSGKPTKAAIKQAVRSLGNKVQVVGGKVVYRTPEQNPY